MEEENQEEYGDSPDQQSQDGLEKKPRKPYAFTQKRQQAWQKALETRRRNIQARKQAEIDNYITQKQQTGDNVAINKTLLAKVRRQRSTLLSQPPPPPQAPKPLRKKKVVYYEETDSEPESDNGLEYTEQAPPPQKPKRQTKPRRQPSRPPPPQPYQPEAPSIFWL